MGYMAGFPPENVGALSSGLGFSALTGAALCVVFQEFDMSVRDEFFCFTPLPILYLLIFFFWLQKPTQEEMEEQMRLKREAAQAVRLAQKSNQEEAKQKDEDAKSEIHSVASSINTLPADTKDISEEQPLLPFDSFSSHSFLYHYLERKRMKRKCLS